MTLEPHRRSPGKSPSGKGDPIPRYRALIVGIVIHVFLSGHPLATASPIVDQDFSPTPPLFTATLSLTGVFAESFTVGIRGLLTGADLLAFDGTPGFGAGAPPVSDMTVQMRTLAAGLPTEIVLGSSIVPATSLQVFNPGNQFTHVDFSSGVPVVPGQMLALAIGGAGVGWS